VTTDHGSRTLSYNVIKNDDGTKTLTGTDTLANGETFDFTSTRGFSKTV
jgi:hypothetical protein